MPRGQTTTDTFTYRANDGHGGTATATVTITVTGAVNHPPVANPDSYTANNDAVFSQNAAGGVLANDTDPDGDTLTRRSAERHRRHCPVHRDQRQGRCRHGQRRRVVLV